MTPPTGGGWTASLMASVNETATDREEPAAAIAPHDGATRPPITTAVAISTLGAHAMEGLR
jgi:hypothetical protein